MKRIKLFPAPHVELRVHVSDQMVEDYKKCFETTINPEADECKCEECSWDGVDIGNTCMCSLDEMEQLLELREE